jgi:PPM family protein phosphatase
MTFHALSHGYLQPAIPEVLLEIAGHTQRGRLSPVNEDHFLVAELSRYVRVRGSSAEGAAGWRFLDPDALALLCAEGMGARQPPSDGAAALAAGAIVDSLWRSMPWPPGQSACVGREPGMTRAVSAAIETAFASAHRVIANEARHGASLAATATLAFLSWPRVWVASLGNSRAYLLRGGHLVRLTNDHTVAEELRDRGVGDGVAVAYEHVLSHVLGSSGAPPHPDILCEELVQGDALLLCTHGLTDHVSDGDLWSAFASGDDPEHVCTRLVAAAVAASGDDDVTVLVARTSGVMKGPAGEA